MPCKWYDSGESLVWIQITKMKHRESGVLICWILKCAASPNSDVVHYRLPVEEEGLSWSELANLFPGKKKNLQKL